MVLPLNLQEGLQLADLRKANSGMQFRDAEIIANKRMEVCAVSTVTRGSPPALKLGDDCPLAGQLFMELENDWLKPVRVSKIIPYPARTTRLELGLHAIPRRGPKLSQTGLGPCMGFGSILICSLNGTLSGMQGAFPAVAHEGRTFPPPIR